MTQLGNLRKRQAAFILAGMGWRPEDIGVVLDRTTRWVYYALADLRRAQAECDRDREAYARELAG